MSCLIICQTTEDLGCQEDKKYLVKTGKTEDLSETGNTYLFTNEVISCFCGCTFKP